MRLQDPWVGLIDNQEIQADSGLMAKNEPKKVYGFIIHTGYVESSRVGFVALHHMGQGFDTLKEALTHLAHYTLDGYLSSFEWTQKQFKEEAEQAKRDKKKFYGEMPEPDLEEFRQIIQDWPSNHASGGIGTDTFDGYHANGEEWWPWDQLHELSPYLKYFWENTEPFEDILPYYLDPERIESESLKAEVIELQNGDEAKDLRRPSVFKQVSK